MIDWLQEYGSLTLLVMILCVMHFLGLRSVRGHGQRVSQQSEPQSQVGARADLAIGQDDPARSEGESPPRGS